MNRPRPIRVRPETAGTIGLTVVIVAYFVALLVSGAVT